ncbi:hepatic and glial cell adhesion molecule-like [Triplophysa rosa]|uniref:hepatic and glial cell adhesion molecule-like n=1 Tax=Triplophysa rosa TaxID=992332 RepID=UPI002545C8FA|nr:hepatic and glial cell adhesion molecule-like [Triplophysa rosa]
MSIKHNLTVLLLCGFALLSVSTKTCEKNLLEGDSCILKLPNETGRKIDANKDEIKWSFTSSSSSFVVQRKNGKNGKTFPDATIESDGSLKLHNVKASNTGKYTFEAYDNKDEMVANHKEEITVYAKALKPNVWFIRCNGNATLTCETQMKDRRDLTITWFKGTEPIQSENKANIILTSTQLQENKLYSCRVHNPVSEAQSDIIEVTCTGETVRIETNGGFPDNWLMAHAVAVGGALLLLLLL